MKITIINFNTNEKNAATLFFDVLVEHEDLAFILKGWKFSDGKMWPPQKRSGRAFYQTVLSSPRFAMRVQAAAEEIGLSGMTLIEDESWAAAKWGQSMLAASIPENPQFAQDLWSHYRKTATAPS